jgi:anti-sigma regulatory factor (Ser/Thr protein kinase)
MTQSKKLSILGDQKYLGLILKVLQELYEGPCDEPIEVTFTIEGYYFKVQIPDYSKQGDIGQIKPPDLKDVKPRELGTHLINEVMDEVNYCINQANGTLLTMIKKLKTRLTPAQDKD